MSHEAAARLLESAADQLDPGDDLRAARTAAGVTQKEAADAISVDRKTWLRWEQGRTRPTDEHRAKLRRLAQKLRDAPAGSKDCF